MLTNTNGIRVLVVDDQEICRNLMRVRLERLGVTVLEATNGADALALCRSNDPHLAFLDIDMPVMDGLESTRNLRSEGFRLKVVGFSAANSPIRTRIGLLAGIDCVVGKHIAQDTLLSFIEQIEVDRI